MRISAVVVTKGDRDISGVTSTLTHFDEVIVWDNSRAARDVKVFGRYAGAYIARNEHVYTQDDDCLAPSKRVAECYMSRLGVVPDLLVCNFPENRRGEYAGTGIALAGWGTVFSRSCLGALSEYLRRWPMDELFERECDRAFTYLNQDVTVLVDHGVHQLPCAYGADRMGREDRHHGDLVAMRARLAEMRRA